MELTLAEICEQVGNFRQDHSQESISDIKNEVNNVYDKVARERRWRDLIVVDEAYSLTTGKKFLALPNDVATVYKIADKSGDFDIDKIDTDHLIADNISTTDSNQEVRQFSELGLRATNQPLPAGVETNLRITSTSNDDADIDVRISGIQGSDPGAGTNGSNLIVNAEATLNGTFVVNVQIGGVDVDWREGWSIRSIYLRSAISGLVTIDDASTVYAEIPAGQRTSGYYVVILANPPSSNSSLYVSYKRRVMPLLDDTDIPIIPVSSYLVETVKGKMRQYDRRYVQAAEHMKDARESIQSVLSEQRLQDTGSNYAQPHNPKRGMYRGF